MTIILIEGEPGALNLRQVKSSLTSEEGGNFDFNALMCDFAGITGDVCPRPRMPGSPASPPRHSSRTKRKPSAAAPRRQRKTLGKTMAARRRLKGAEAFSVYHRHARHA
jgi:hypothetical protein